MISSDTAVIIPAYNEAKVIGDTLARAAMLFSNLIVVDDGSSDDTGEIAKRQIGCTVLRHCTNIGQGGAILTGVKWALKNNAKYFITFDADGQHRPEDAHQMLEYLIKNDVDIVLGSRFLKNDSFIPYKKRCVLKAACAISRSLHGIDVTDAHNGLRVFNRKTASVLDFKNYDMAHASEFYDVIVEHGLRYAEFPVIIDYTNYSIKKGQSVYNAINILTDLLLQRIR